MGFSCGSLAAQVPVFLIGSLVAVCAGLSDDACQVGDCAPPSQMAEVEEVGLLQHSLARDSPDNDLKQTQLVTFRPPSTNKSEAQCFAFTGESCAYRPCSAESGAACQAGKCICRRGCAGLDGTCHAQEYKPVLAEFTLQNAKWSTNYMYVKRFSIHSQMGLTESPFWIRGQEKFSLYALPGKENRYLMASAKWPRWVITMQELKGLTLGVEPVGLYAEDIEDEEMTLEGISVTVCTSVGRNVIMIGGGQPTAWAIAKRGSWDVFGVNDEDLDAEGHWIIDPPLPKGAIPPCRGDRKWRK